MNNSIKTIRVFRSDSRDFQGFAFQDGLCTYICGSIEETVREIKKEHQSFKVTFETKCLEETALSSLERQYLYLFLDREDDTIIEISFSQKGR